MVVVMLLGRSENIVLMVLNFSSLMVLRTFYNCLIRMKLEVKEKCYLTCDIGMVEKCYFKDPKTLSW